MLLKGKIDEIIFQLQALVDRSDRLKSKLRDELSSASSMLHSHLSQAASFKRKLAADLKRNPDGTFMKNSDGNNLDKGQDVYHLKQNRGK